MSVIKETVILSCSEVDENANKYWKGILYENNDVYTEWGRVGAGSPQSKTYYGAGRSKLDAKVREKKKGKLNKRTGKQVYYTEARVVDTGKTGTTQVNHGSVDRVATQELKTGNRDLDALVDRLIQSNIHNITTSTSITYSATTGLFSTPLGIVTPDAIDDARLILADIKRQFDDETKLKSLVASYLRLVPHDIGRKFRIESIFPNNDTAIKAELDILDSLSSSYDALQTQTTKVLGTSPKSKSKVFDVDLDILSRADREYGRVVKYIERTKKGMHNYNNVRVKNIYKVQINSMHNSYNHKIGNDKEVFHGTSEANLLSILKSGLRCAPPTSAYIAGKMFGNGIYGTETSTKAMGYTFGRWGGRSSGNTGWIFICDFAMGVPHYPSGYQSGRYTPPSGHDSCWALPKKTQLYNDELIVYKDQQSNIKYLVELG
jgi:poly [ADP-ribose] polymerase 2/3/4